MKRFAFAALKDATECQLKKWKMAILETSKEKFMNLEPMDHPNK